ncbi:hypothetical protein ABK040_001454 [Willaertia magna]
MIYSPVEVLEESYPTYDVPPKPTPLTTGYVKQLIKIRDDMENEIKHLILSLDKTGVGLKGNLVDDEGFPRNDLDLNDIRSKRHRIACLQNDHIKLMNDIQELMYELHEQSKEQTEHNEDVTMMEKQVETIKEEEEETPLDPFLKVNSIASTSPAERAGLLPNDLILQFGYLLKQDIDRNGLKILPSYVQSNVNKPLKVIVLRKEKEEFVKKELTFVPAYWSGQGLLGCHLVEFK